MERDAIRQLPKGEFHLHIEGSLPWVLLRKREPERYGTTPASWAPGFRYRNFDHFEEDLLAAASYWFKTPEDYHTACREIFREQVENSVRYAEVSFASGCLEYFGDLPLCEVLHAIKSAAPDNLAVRVFFGIHHDGYTPIMGPMIEQALNEPLLDGFDLHGVETHPLESWTGRIWRDARAAGKFTKAHAGEFDGPDFIRRVVEELGVTRIEHGTRAAEDPAVMAFLRDRGVTLDMCPVSNLKLGVVPSLKEHPLPLFIRNGINCTISRDDSLSFGSTLTDEYALLQAEGGLTDTELVSLMAGGFRAALVPEEQKKQWLTELASRVKD